MVIVFLAQARALAHRGDSGAGDPLAVAMGMFEQRQLMWPWLGSLTATLLAEVYLDLDDVEKAERWTERRLDSCLYAWPDAGILPDFGWRRSRQRCCSVAALSLSARRRCGC